MDLMQLLLSAMESEMGIEVHSSSAPQLRQKLYPLLKNPGFAQLSLHLNPADPKHFLWIRKSSTPSPAPSSEEPSNAQS